MIREMAVNLDELARDLLVSPHQWSRTEVVMEVYRQIVVTGTECGARWRKSDPWRHMRYPKFPDAVGRPVPGPYEDLAFALDNSSTAEEHMSRIVARAVLGRHPVLARWRRDQGRLTCVRLPCRVRRARAERWVDLRALLDEPVGRSLTVQFNSVHELARIVHRVFLVPGQDGWSLGVEYGCSDDPRPMRGRRAVSSWVALRGMACGADDPQSAVPTQREREPTSMFVRRCADYVNSVTRK